jgi:hypothetical protein
MILLKQPFEILKSKANDTRKVVGIAGPSLSEEPYSFEDSKKSLSTVMESLGKCLNRAYGVGTYVEQREGNVLSAEVSPIEAELKGNVFDRTLEHNFSNSVLYKRLQNVYRRMDEEKKENAIIVWNGNYYIFHGLQPVLNPEPTLDILRVVPEVLLTADGQKYRSSSEISQDSLRVDIEIEPPKFSF